MEITVKLTPDEIENLTESVRNGACAYWAAKIVRPTGTPKSQSFPFTLLTHEGEGYILDAAKLHKGVALAILNCKSVGSQLHNGIDACDQCAVDCIVQYALFGKLVYG